MTPSQELYDTLGAAYEHFNVTLFDSKLPAVVFVMQRSTNGMMGHFGAQRWVNRAGDQASEISINPSYMAHSRLIEVMQTLVHEMAHCWQCYFGKPSRGGYHNKQWAKKMIAIGLMPSTTGAPGGDITGQNMADYVIQGGAFHLAYHDLIANKLFKLHWVDRFAVVRLRPASVVSPDVITDQQMPGAKEMATLQAGHLTISESDPAEDWLNDYNDLPSLLECFPDSFIEPMAAKRKTRYRFMCPKCETKVYGKYDLDIHCNDCACNFEYADE